MPSAGTAPTVTGATRGGGPRGGRFFRTARRSRRSRNACAGDAPYLRSQVKSRVAELRDALPLEDQELLILRVNTLRTSLDSPSNDLRRFASSTAT